MNATPHVYDVTEHEFPARVLERSHEVPVLVDFWAEWCGPCQMLMPLLAKLAAEYEGKFEIAKVDTDRERGLASAYGIRSIPNVKVFRDGELVDEMLGAQPESVIRSIIDRYIERESDRVRTAAGAALRAGDAATALALLRGAAASDPDNLRVQLDLAAALIREGALEEAEGMLQALPRNVRDEPDAAALLGLLEFARIAQSTPATPDRATLEARLKHSSEDLEARHALSAHLVLAGEHEAALQHLLEIMQRDRGFRDDAGRKGMLAVFNLLGGKGELVNRYRTRMFNALH